MATKLTPKNVKAGHRGSPCPMANTPSTQQPGLWLYVRGDGRHRSYQHCYRWHGKEVFGKVGSVRKMTLDEAREEVIRQKAALLDGEDPSVVKTAGPVTFKEDVMAYYEWSKGGGDNETNEGWSDGTATAFLRSFENHLFPKLGDRETATLTAREVAAVIEPVWKANNNTGQRLCQRVHAVLEHAIDLDEEDRFPSKHNVADGLLRRLPKGYRKVARPMVAAKWEVMPMLYARWVAEGGMSMAAYALRFLALTCAPRASEVFKMRWCELDGNTWTVPKERMKNRVTRQIPLSAEAMAVLDAVRRDSNCDPDGFVFAGRGEGGRIGIHAMLNLLRKMELDLHVHGFQGVLPSRSRSTT